MGNILGSANDWPSLLLTEGTTPTTPAASHDRLFVRSSDHLLCLVNSSGTVTAVGTGLVDPMTTRGDVIVRNASNVTARLAIGSSGKVLSSDGTDVSWATPAAGGITRTTLGTTSVGGSFATRGMYVKKITLATDGLISSINAHMKGNATNNNVIVPVMYSDTAGAPINLLFAPGTPISSTPTRLEMGTLNATARWLRWGVGSWLTAGSYWIGVYFNDATGSATSLAFSSGTGSDSTVAGGTNNLPQDSSVQAISTGTNDYSIYADILR